VAGTNAVDPAGMPTDCRRRDTGVEAWPRVVQGRGACGDRRQKPAPDPGVMSRSGLSLNCAMRAAPPIDQIEFKYSFLDPDFE
jgi:hypothetical protein